VPTRLVEAIRFDVTGRKQQMRDHEVRITRDNPVKGGNCVRIIAQ
jgi:hypothetical protein